MRILRESLTALAALLAVALVALAAVPPFIDWKPWREQIAALAAPTLGLPIRFGGELRLSMLPTPEIDADQVSIGPEDRPLLTAGRLTLSLDLTALARGILRITEARGDQVSVRAEAIDLLPKPGEGPAAPGRKLGLDRLTLKRVTLIRKDGDDALAPPLDIVLEAPDFAGPFRFEVTIPREGREWRGQIGRFEDGRARLRATAEDHPRAIRAMADGWFGQPGHPSQPAFDGQVQVSGNPVFGRGNDTVQMPFDLQARVLLQAGQLSPRPRCFVFSAGVNAELRSRLHDAGAEKVIDKPIGVGPLRDALLSTPPATPAMAQGGDACERYFAGDRALYQAFQACARPQLRADLQTGDAALAAADLPALRRLGHSLKTALQMIDEPAVGELARALEASAKTGDEAAARRDWLRLRDALHRLHGDPV